jgi:hypothetical protein
MITIIPSVYGPTHTNTQVVLGMTSVYGQTHSSVTNTQVAAMFVTLVTKLGFSITGSSRGTFRYETRAIIFET